MTSKPSVSILLPMYNESLQYAELSVNSILNQSFEDFELIIALDNPQNQILCDYVRDISSIDSRVRFIKNERNIGLPATLNRMIDSVTTKYIARMDADDISLPTRLEKQFRFMEANEDVDLCGTKILYIDSNGDPVKGEWKTSLTHKSIAKQLKINVTIAHPTYFCKSDMMKNLHYRESLIYAQDYDFLCRAVESGYKLANIDEFLLKYRLGTTSPKKVTRQMVTAYFVKKYYKKSVLCAKESIGNDIEQYIKHYGEDKLTKRNSISEIIKKIKLSLTKKNFPDLSENIVILLTPHPHKINHIICERFLIRFHKFY